ncbi:hypothetical protein CR203_18600 [Salipaludibacillus neizhouensis]|uniref:Uncharacterized protein n=1 Tax=Salipaludibacillus neizhouensis TaxID=885475 RepID=A0A3A9K5V8_9BACI|nr:hypothetical protein [Salipaludibacillus neizhouensis]RKL65862.1 hypothetical protein CR203_18600 [Salipaludibacillus neizhouensis]
MKEYRFNRQVNQKIVNGVLQGYKNYIQERIEKDLQMKISSAYAWVKGNHIDDQTAVECEEIGINYKKARAGYTWGYLQFIASNDQSMFIIKNNKYFDQDNFPDGKGVNGKKRSHNDENYLKKLSRINNKVDFPTPLTLLSEENVPHSMSILDDAVLKSLEDSDVSNLQEVYNKFYIFTYSLDQANMVSSIKMWMPNPANDKAYLVEDLTELIDASSVDISGIDTSVLEDDQSEFDFDSPAAIEYDIFHEEDLPSENEGNDER